MQFVPVADVNIVQMKFIFPTYQEKQKQMTYDPTISTLRTLNGT